MPIAGRVRDQHFMLQKEVVDRMVASPGGRTYGRLSVMLQSRYRLTKLFIGPGAFRPAPEVTSSIVRMQPLPVALHPAADARRFAQVVLGGIGRRQDPAQCAGRTGVHRRHPRGSGRSPGPCRNAFGNDFARLTRPSRPHRKATSALIG